MGDGESIKVWDIAVRLFHWSLVLSFTVAYVSGEEWEGLHVYAGYGVLGLVLFRILWGFVGSRHARFSDFLYGPRAIAEYVRGLLAGSPKHYMGHNPAGGAMVVVLLASLLVVSWTGLEAYGAEGHGPLSAVRFSLWPQALADGGHGEDGEKERAGHEDHDEFWEEAHEAAANLTLFLVVLHILGVVVSSRLHRENLVKAMISGRKDIPPER